MNECPSITRIGKQNLIIDGSERDTDVGLLEMASKRQRLLVEYNRHVDAV